MNSSLKNNICGLWRYSPLIILFIKLLSVKMLIATPFIILFWQYKIDILSMFLEILFGILSDIGPWMEAYQGPTRTEILDYMQQEPDPSKVIDHFIAVQRRSETLDSNNNLPVAEPVTYSSHLKTSQNEPPMALPIPSAPALEIK